MRILNKPSTFWRGLCLAAILTCFPLSSAESFNDPVQITTHPGEDFAPTISRDGQIMVYVSDQSGNLDLWVKPLGPGVHPPDSRLTFHSSADNSPALSPDGKTVAFVSNRSDAKGDLYLLPLSAAENKAEQESGLVRLTDGTAGESDPAWSPDQKWIFFASPDPESSIKKIYKLDVKAGTKSPVSTIDGTNPSVSPDGRHLAFVSMKNDPTGSIWVQDLHFQLHPLGNGAQQPDADNARGGNRRHPALVAGRAIDLLRPLWRRHQPGRQTDDRRQTQYMGSGIQSRRAGKTETIDRQFGLRSFPG